MERGSRVLWAAGVAACPAALLIGMLFFQLKKVEILNQDIDAELQLGRQRRRRAMLEQEPHEAESGSTEFDSGSAPATQG